MADALEAVLRLREEKRARELSDVGQIGAGLSNFGSSILGARRLQQEGALAQAKLQQDARKAQIDELLALAKIKDMETKQQNMQLMSQRLNQFLTQGGSGGDEDFAIDTLDPVTGKFTLKNVGLQRQRDQEKADLQVETAQRKRELTGEEQKTVAGAENIETNVNEVLGLLDNVVTEKGGFDDRFVRSRIDAGNALLVSGDAERLQSAVNKLKAQIPFAKGGKQLTPFEARTLFRLLDMTGKEKETIRRDLNSFVQEFGRLSELAKTGKVGEPSTGKSALPAGVSEADIKFTMKKHGMTRQQVLEALGA
jgi:hypothetical protein